MIWAWIDTSSADTGSSPTINSGFNAKARAIPIRWRWPPENSCGYECMSCALRPTRSNKAATRSRRSLRPAIRWMISGSPTMSPADMRGFKEA